MNIFFCNITQNKFIELTYASAKDEEYLLKNKIAIFNKKVQLSGAKSILKKYSKVKTEKISKKMLKNDKLTVKLVSPDPSLNLKQTEISFEIEKTKQITRTISLIPVTFPSNLNIAIIPQKVSAMIKGPEDIVKNISSKKIVAKLSLEKINKNNFAEVDFELPVGVKLIEYTPRKIQIIKND